MRKFRLTALFILISGVTFAGAAIAINVSSARSEERNIISLTTAQSVKDAKLIAGIVTQLLSDDGQNASTDADEVGAMGLTIAEFLRSSSIVRLTLYDPAGNHLWSSVTGYAPIDDSQLPIFRTATSGTIASGLLRGQSVVGPDGERYSADVVETYIPLMDADLGILVSVLVVTRDVTDSLDKRIAGTRREVTTTTMTSMGIGFMILLVSVLIADLRLWHHRVRAITYERELASRELVATKLSLENRELQRIDEERTRFLNTVSHELKTPLTSMIAFADILSKHQDGPSRDRNMKQLGIIQKNGHRLTGLITDLLDYSKLKDGNIELALEAFGVEGAVADVAQTMAPLVAAKSQRLEIVAPPSGTLVELDRGRILQVLMNLVSNASKYSPDGAVIRLEARMRPGNLQLIVEDNGIGMSEADQRRVFTKFFRADNEHTRSVGGTGLGMPITQAIVEAHGGDIGIWSQVGVGTCVTVNIPVDAQPTASALATSADSQRASEARERIVPDPVRGQRAPVLANFSAESAVPEPG